MFIPVRVIDFGDVNYAENVGYLRADKIVSVMPARRQTNKMEQQQHEVNGAKGLIVPQFKKYTAVHVEGMGTVPCSDPVDWIMKRIVTTTTHDELAPKSQTEPMPGTMEVGDANG